MIGISFPQRISILIGILIVGFMGLFAVDPISQDPEYHRFADTRPHFGIPNFSDVVSNVGLALAGALGLVAVLGRKRRTIFTQPADARPYDVFFIGVCLVSVGSAFYHWAPSNERLLWDRLPISVAFMAFCSAVVADRIDAKAGNTWLLPVLVAFGLMSLVYWYWTESLGHGDLRFYGFVQFYPVVALPFVCWLFPENQYTAGRHLTWVIGWYALSKLLEYFDREVFGLSGHAISGHTLKHLAAAVATLLVLRMLLSRQSSNKSG